MPVVLTLCCKIKFECQLKSEIHFSQLLQGSVSKPSFWPSKLNKLCLFSWSQCFSWEESQVRIYNWRGRAEKQYTVHSTLQTLQTSAAETQTGKWSYSIRPFQTLGPGGFEVFLFCPTGNKWIIFLRGQFIAEFLDNQSNWVVHIIRRKIFSFLYTSPLFSRLSRALKRWQAKKNGKVSNLLWICLNDCPLRHLGRGV